MQHATHQGAYSEKVFPPLIEVSKGLELVLNIAKVIVTKDSGPHDCFVKENRYPSTVRGVYTLLKRVIQLTQCPLLSRSRGVVEVIIGQEGSATRRPL
jgi:hypothetical protein